MMTIPKLSFGIFSFLLLVYLVLPGPTSINDFPALPNSVKSDLSGDTWQIPNVSAYFSDIYRDFATNLYKQVYQNKTHFPFPPIKLNYPPEFAYTAIKDQTQSTYLEEYVYPLRDSLFVNGLEPISLDGSPRYWGAIKFEIGDRKFLTKVTLRYYPSPLWVRLLVWLGITVSIFCFWKIIRRVVKRG